jgi:hypothetical protein
LQADSKEEATVTLDTERQASAALMGTCALIAIRWMDRNNDKDQPTSDSYRFSTALLFRAYRRGSFTFHLYLVGGKRDSDEIVNIAKPRTMARPEHDGELENHVQPDLEHRHTVALLDHQPKSEVCRNCWGR